MKKTKVIAIVIIALVSVLTLCINTKSLAGEVEGSQIQPRTVEGEPDPISAEGEPVVTNEPEDTNNISNTDDDHNHADTR